MNAGVACLSVYLCLSALSVWLSVLTVYLYYQSVCLCLSVCLLLKDDVLREATTPNSADSATVILDFSGNKTWEDMRRQYKPRPEKKWMIRRDKARQNKARQDTARHDTTTNTSQHKIGFSYTFWVMSTPFHLLKRHCLVRASVRVMVRVRLGLGLG